MYDFITCVTLINLIKVNKYLFIFSERITKQSNISGLEFLLNHISSSCTICHSEFLNFELSICKQKYLLLSCPLTSLSTHVRNPLVLPFFFFGLVWYTLKSSNLFRLIGRDCCCEKNGKL